jgi:diguanylate cyclase (GGDEF)-like protein
MAAKAHILLADDNKLVMKVNSSILENEGYKVDVAWDGVEAVSRAYSLLPDLVILDIEMPKIKGYQVCRLLKDDPQTSWMPVIMLTGREQQSDMFWGLKTGADAYITKGFKPETLINTVRELLEKGKEAGRAGETAHKRAREVTEDYVIDKVMDLLDTKLYETTVLNEIAALSGTLQDYSETVRSVFEIIGKLVNYDLGGLLLFEEGDLFLYPNREFPEARVDEFINVISDIAVGYAWERKEKGELNTVVFNEGLLAKGEEAQKAPPAYFHIPLTAQKKTMGALMLSGPASPAFKRDTPAFLNLILNEITMVLDNARLYEAAKRLAITDGLTKIYNHRFFQELFEKEFKRSDRYGTIFSLIMLDIDFFKKINDNYGHLYGDEILKEIAELVKGCLRTMDLLARYGGEEFAILLPETNLPEAVQTAERIRRAVESFDFMASRGKGLKVTVSQGVTYYPSAGVTARSDIVGKADSALYEAKESGRNRVFFRE